MGKQAYGPGEETGASLVEVAVFEDLVTKFVMALGPAYWNADVSLFKNSRLSERFNLQFRVEAFNVFNHTNFQLGHNDITDPQFGEAQDTFPARNLQFALKLSF